MGINQGRAWPGWLLRFASYVGMIAAVALLPHADLANRVHGDLFTEYTVLETTGTFLIGIPAVILVFVGIYHPAWRSISLTMALMLGAAVTRELDYLLDMVFDGLWQLVVSLLLLITAGVVWRDRTNFASRLRQYSESIGFGLMLAGLLTSTVFSRLFGMRTFWESVMGDGYMRSVKNAAEETIELLGYTFIAIGVVEFYLWLRRISRS